MLKTVIVSPPAKEWVLCPYPLLGPSILKSFLGSKGYKIDLVDLSVRVRNLNRYPIGKAFNLMPFWDKKLLIDFLESGKGWKIKREVEKMIRLGNLTHYDVIGFSLYSSINLLISLPLAKVLKEDYGKKIVFGGPIITKSDCDFLLHFDFVDFLVEGDGEEPFLRLLRYFEDSGDIGGCRGISYKKNGKIKKSGPSVFPLKKKSLPSFNMEDFELYKKLSIGNFAVLPYLLTRGCRFKCAFCNETEKVGFEYVPLEKAISEIGNLVKTYRLDSIYFSHTNINNDPDYTKDLSDLIIKNKLKFLWGGNASIWGLDEDIIKAMSKAGCRYLFVGVETASESLRKKMNIRKVGDLKEFKETLQLLHKYGICTHAYYIVGLPHEKYEDFEETIHYIRETARYTTTATVNIFYLKEHSPIAMSPKAFGIKIRKSPEGKYSFLEKSFAYKEDNFDEIGGLNMEDRKKRDRAKQKILERLIRRKMGLKLILNIMNKDPLYPVKKKISHRYLNYDEYLLL